MDFAVYEFLEFLNGDISMDYGDFKREVDYHLQILEQSMRPLNPEQQWQIRKMREQLLWSYQFDIVQMRRTLREEAHRLEEYSSSER
jgi:hypothetical protein